MNVSRRGSIRPPGRFCLCLIVAAILVADDSGAADAAESDDAELVETRPMEYVQVTATRKEESVYDVSEAVTVVDARRIVEIAPQVISEVLRFEPGAFFQQTTPGQGIPIVRGLKGSQVLHLVDGMRLNNAFFRDAPNQYIGLVDPFNMERVELVRGASPTLYGADAMGGVVQFLTQEERFEGSEWQSRARLYSSYASTDDSIVGRVQAAAGIEGRSISGGVTWRNHDDRRVGGGAVIRPSEYRVEGGDFKWLEAVGNGELMISAQWLEQPSTPRVDELVPGFGQDQPSSEQYAFEPNRRSFLHARYSADSDSRWLSRISLDIARQIIDDDRVTQEHGSDLVNRERNRSTLDGLTVQALSEIADGASSLTWGAEYYTDTVDSSRTVANLASGAEDRVRGRFPDASTMDSTAVYASLTWHNDALKLHGGLRYSAFDIFLPATGEIPAADLSPTDLTGDIHLEWAMSERVNLVANAGRGFRPPNVFDLGTLGPRPGNRFNQPNPDLKPESVWSYDIGIKTRGERWQAEVYVFYSDYEDKIGSRETGEITAGGRVVVQSDNINQAELYGIESGVRGYLGETIEVYSVLNLMRANETEADGAEFPGDRIPPANGKFGLVWRPSDKLRVEPFVGFAAEQDRLSPRDERDPRINPAGTRGWGTINLLASYQPIETLQLGLRLENLGDRNYREHGSGIDATGRNVGLWFNYIFN